MSKKRFSVVGEWDGPEETLHPELDIIEAQVNLLVSKGVSNVYYGRADDEPYVSPPPPPVIYHRPTSTCGFHITSGPRTGYGDALRNCHRSVSIQSVLDFGALWEAHQIDPRTVTVARIYPIDNDSDTPPGNWQWSVTETKVIALDWMAKSYPVLDQNQFKPDYVGNINEPDPADAEAMKRADDFMLYCMQDADVHGVKMAIWAWTAGLPRTPRILASDFAQAEASLESVRYAGEHGHCLSVHDGSVDGGRPLFRQAYDDQTALRYRVIKALMDERGWPMPTTIVTEAYQQGFYKNPNWGDLTWYLQQLALDPYMTGCCLFTLGNYGDQNISGQLEKLTDLIAAMPEVV